MENKPVFSIITICYRRLALFQEALEAMLRQTYPHIEIVIVSNGAIPEVYEYITDLAKHESRVKIIYFKENLYRDDDPHYFEKVCFNAGLREATGDYVWYQSDDDMIADDYVEKMVALFQGNPACTTAAGITQDIDINGRLLAKGARISNFRPRYMPGHLLALSTLNKDQQEIMFSAPGCIFAFKRKEFIEMGGYHPCLEPSALYGIVPLGVTGFDETAILYWRRHEGQTHIHGNLRGQTCFKEYLDLLEEWQIEKRWEIFGKDIAHYVVRRINEINYEGTTQWFVVHCYYFRLKAAAFIFKDLWYRPYFWRLLPIFLWKEKRQFKYFLKPFIKSIFETNIWLQKVPLLSRLREKAFK